MQKYSVQTRVSAGFAAGNLMDARNRVVSGQASVDILVKHFLKLISKPFFFPESVSSATGEAGGRQRLPDDAKSTSNRS